MQASDSAHADTGILRIISSLLFLHVPSPPATPAALRSIPGSRPPRPETSLILTSRPAKETPSAKLGDPVLRPHARAGPLPHLHTAPLLVRCPQKEPPMIRCTLAAALITAAPLASAQDCAWTQRHV